MSFPSRGPHSLSVSLVTPELKATARYRTMGIASTTGFRVTSRASHDFHSGFHFLFTKGSPQCVTSPDLRREIIPRFLRSVTKQTSSTLGWVFFPAVQTAGQRSRIVCTYKISALHWGLCHSLSHCRHRRRACDTLLLSPSPSPTMPLCTRPVRLPTTQSAT